MTIVAGFHLFSSVIIGADRQETAGAIKIQKEKLRFRPGGMTPYDHVRAIFAGAGEAVFTDMVADHLWEVINTSGSRYEDILAAIEQRATDTHEKYHRFSTAENRYETDMLIGLWIKE